MPKLLGLLADPGDLGLFIRQETAPVNRTKIGETLYRLTRRDDGRYPVTEITHEDR